MISFKRLTVFILLSVFLTRVDGQHHKENLTRDADNVCIDSLKLSSRSLSDMLQSYVMKVRNNSLPIMAVQHQKDTTFYYVSALINTNSIRKNVPTSILNQFGKEVLFYDYGNPSKIDSVCQQYLVDKYLKTLHVDVLNTKYGKPPGTPRGFTYDPMLIKIAVVADRPTVVKSDSFPNFKYSN